MHAHDVYLRVQNVLADSPQHGVEKLAVTGADGMGEDGPPYQVRGGQLITALRRSTTKQVARSEGCKSCMSKGSIATQVKKELCRKTC